MRKFAAVIMSLFCAVIIFFSLLGDRIYRLVTPNARTYTVSAAVRLESGEIRLTLPKECLKGGKVWLLEPSYAFERTVFTLKSVEVSLSESEFYSDLYIVESGLAQGDVAVVSCEKEPREGMRVEIEG